MLLNHAKSIVTEEGSLGKRQATVSLNPIIMHVLSRDLYSRPVEAVFRETLTNALDAHIEAGVEDLPIDIKLPFYGSEEFYIRDYGKGIAVERMKDHYLDFGDSTRRESNEFMGAFGLGCKSPLAYTSAFMVTSFHAGYKNEFLVYYDQDNIPCIDHRLSEPTDEPSGLKVSLSLINISDYVLFHNAAEAVLPYIPQDKYCLLEPVTYVKNIVLSEGEQYGNVTLRSGSNKLRVVMGYVAYNVDIQAVTDYLSTNVKAVTLTEDISVNALSLVTRLVDSYAVTIESELGRYPIHPSREHINITPRAIAMLLADLSLGVKELFSSCGDDCSITTDILYHRFTNEIRNNDFKIRARVVTPSKWTYNAAGELSTIIRSYKQLVDYISTVVHGTMSVAYIDGTDFIDYLGDRRSYSYAGVKQNILFIDSDNSADIASYLPYELYDCAADVEKYRRDENFVSASLQTKRIGSRIAVRSLQDTTHNVMLLSCGIGDAKKCWASAKHNVESLQALNKEIFWVPTKMGCIKDKDALTILSFYDRIFGCIPEWKKPVIVGLPATKGTVQIERQFKPVAELQGWIDQFLASDYFKRRNYFVSANRSIEEGLKIAALPLYEKYGLTDLLQRVYAAGKRYKNSASVYAAAKVRADNLEWIVPFKEEAINKFNFLSGEFVWYNSKLIGDKTWPEQLAELLDRKPTSAIYKNRGY